MFYWQSHSLKESFYIIQHFFLYKKGKISNYKRNHIEKKMLTFSKYHFSSIRKKGKNVDFCLILIRLFLYFDIANANYFVQRSFGCWCCVIGSIIKAYFYSLKLSFRKHCFCGCWVYYETAPKYLVLQM